MSAPSSSPSAPARPGRAVGRPSTTTAPTGEDTAPGGGRVVHAAGRFRELVAGRPWRRRRRLILAVAAGVVAVLVALAVTAIFLPALQLREISVSGLGYVDEDEVRGAVSSDVGDSMVLLPTADIAERVSDVPGVHDVQVERNWPDGVEVTVTESTPVGLLTTTDGSTVVIGAEGEELPEAAAEGETLVPLTVEPGAIDPEGAATAMREVLANIPDSLRGSVKEATASSASDVNLVLTLEDGGTKSVVWGDSADAELKAEVVEALLDQPGSEIDVSSPVAPVTR
ncbi:cell division protein FtsQ/DivIB [Brachybacterium alimentarium]|uniref:cell division protein FtsQ/DivIB n=1 Tax=Brachybacterium alimentarium TaxID=47845 RepID=UPI001FE89906|nr:FtsQ-type POTRA domain-containing protein [Brachybacterium alimentarium]